MKRTVCPECGGVKVRRAVRCVKCRPKLPVSDRFWPKVDKSGECWVWMSSTDRYGYGQIAIGGHKPAPTHRVSWQLAYGPIPKGMCVLHRCDTPLCVRPDHLWLGTRADNNHDMIAKGRAYWQKAEAS